MLLRLVFGRFNTTLILNSIQDTYSPISDRTISILVLNEWLYKLSNSSDVGIRDDIGSKKGF